METVLTELRWGQFAIFDYMDSSREHTPYAQVAFSVDGYYCEVVSEAYLSADDWPIDRQTLLAEGWQVPDDGTLNWWRSGLPDAGKAASAVASALSEGRACQDASHVRWHVGVFTPPPDGGEAKPRLTPTRPALHQAA